MIKHSELIKLAEDFKKSDYSAVKLSKVIDMPQQTILYRLRKYERIFDKKIILRKGKHLSRPGNKKYSFDEKYFEKINTPEKAYILGFLYADGCNDKKQNRVTIQVGEKDKKILYFVKKQTSYSGPIKFQKIENKNHQNRVILCFGSKNLCSILEKQGVVPPPKDFSIEFPSKKIMNEKLLKYFVLGFFDGDGSAFIKNGKPVASFSCASYNFIIKLKEFLLKKNISSSLYKNKKRNSYELTIYSKMNIKNFTKLLYRKNLFCLKRKKKILCEYVW